ncbi:hypothetical protein [Dokdonia sp.]|uniref:hypothetical protein n=1 Tax=Dokdonia sp. TaxID=2024995 RepID=UPI0032677CFC
MEFPYTNVQEYLKASGILEKGTPEAIANARKLFRKLYLKQYKKEYAKDHSNVTISFTKEDKSELKAIAVEQGKRLASYIKEISIKQLDQHARIRNNEEDVFLEMKQLLSLCLDIVEALQFENEYPRLNNSFSELETLFNQMCVLIDNDH